MKFTWERIEGKQLWFDVRFADHLPRYKLAQKYCEGKKVLDIACGTGYGSKELAEVASSVIGIDVDKASVELAQKMYQSKNLQFKLGNGQDIQVEDESMDVVVSFETIEHIVDYHQFMRELKRVLKPGGTLILSTPNYLGEVHKNIYHVSNFTTIHLIDVFKQYFSDFSVKYQGKHLFPFPGRGFWQVLLSWFWVKRDVKIRDEKPSFEHHVTIIVAKK